MISNDNDPVEVYYKSAVEFCNKAADQLNMMINKQKPEDPGMLANKSKKKS